MNQTIEKTKKLQKEICIGCGACTYVCPSKCIDLVIDKMGRVAPRTYKDKCINCHQCTDICINNIVNNARNYSNISDDKILVGDIRKSYVAWAKDPDIRKNASSGGFVTTLLCHLLEHNIVDYASIIVHDPNGLTQARMIFTNSIDEVKNSSGSKYIAVDISLVIKQIVSKPSTKYAIVGLPCHFAAILNVLANKGITRENIFFIGLVCSKTLNYGIYDYFRSTVSVKDIKKFDFRYKINGAPGDVCIESGGNKYIVPIAHRRALNRFYKNIRCLECVDRYNVFSDITVGDCFVKKYETTKGESTILIRTDIGESFFNLVKDRINYIQEEKENLIHISKYNSQLLYSQSKGNFPQLVSKKLGAKAKIKIKLEILLIYISHMLPNKILNNYIKILTEKRKK